ncbi:putative glycosyl transferase [Pseudobdellovibrio exovorus JSS]|uniref:Putative glycosyl transferase n=2 Tax=Pseudobdellovibrio exovorus TaxID=453816 RepID=M4V8E3_9BACT|nr:putative glycosyl transferase [Pseudobdellovibrio exovorus JSS]
MKGCDIKNVSEQKIKIPITVTLIALNEERNIQRALSSVQWAEDIVVYDSGSTDNTIEIAKKMGARVVQGEWLGFGPSKRMAVQNAHCDWILSLDCDEEVDMALQQEIQKRLPDLNPKVAYKVPRLSYHMKRWIRHGGWYPDYQIRLFNRKFANWNEAKIHEKVEASSYEKFVSHLNHYVFLNVADQVRTNNKYSSLQAQEMWDRGKRFSLFHFLTKPYVKFVECYFWKLGLLDGWAGYVIARNAAYSVYLKWVKLKELEG